VSPHRRDVSDPSTVGNVRNGLNSPVTVILSRGRKEESMPPINSTPKNGVSDFVKDRSEVSGITDGRDPSALARDVGCCLV